MLFGKPVAVAADQLKKTGIGLNRKSERVPDRGL
jgi:hypothetical protein